MLGEIDVRQRATVVTLHGDLDLMTVDRLRTMLTEVTDTAPGRVVIDLTDVPFVDVMSLSVILGTADTLRDSGRELTVNGASSSFRRLCALLNADDVLAPVLPAPRIAAQN